jgi:hypothetical protein
LRRNATHWPERRNSRLRKAWAIFSGSTNWEASEFIVQAIINGTYLVELVAEVYRVNIVTLQVGKHDDLFF